MTAVTRRASVRRLGVRIAAATATAILVLSAAAAPAHADAPGDVEIVDPLGVLAADRVREHAQSLDFYRPVDVVVLVVDSGGDPENLNVKVRDIAFADHRDWLSPDEQYWRDGLVIFAVDPHARQVGTYFGEDLDVSDADQALVQDSSKDDFRRGRWTDGTLAALDELASVVDRPRYRTPAPYVGAGAGAALGSGVWGYRRVRARQYRREYEQARAVYAEVTISIDELEVNVATIPADSPYGSRVLDQYRQFNQTHRRATVLGDALGAVDPKHFHRAPVRGQVREFVHSVESADRIVDLVENCNAILNRSPTWADAWEHEVRPIRDDIDAAGRLVQELPELADSSSATELRAGAATASADLDQLTRQMHAGEIAPDTASGRLDQTVADLGRLAERHSNAMIAHYARSEAEEKRMRASMSAPHGGGYDSGDNYVRSVNYPPAASVSALTFGYLAAASAVDSSRASSSSGGSSSGSSSSFSGRGSSSSF